MTFTAKQISDWRAYERVRASGRHNMLTSAAQQATGLDRDAYVCVHDDFGFLVEVQR